MSRARVSLDVKAGRKRPRLYVTLSPEAHARLEALAREQQRSRSACLDALILATNGATT